MIYIWWTSTMFVRWGWVLQQHIPRDPWNWRQEPKRNSSIQPGAVAAAAAAEEAPRCAPHTGRVDVAVAIPTNFLSIPQDLEWLVYYVGFFFRLYGVFLLRLNGGSNQGSCHLKPFCAAGEGPSAQRLIHKFVFFSGWKHQAVEQPSPQPSQKWGVYGQATTNGCFSK